MELHRECAHSLHDLLRALVMATGLKVWTNNGSVLTIDQDYENLSLYSSGTAQTSSANSEVAFGL